MIRDIDIDDHGNAPDRDLYRATHDEARWNNRSNVDRKIVFGPKGSPFGDSDEIVVPAGTSVTSGPITTTDPDPAKFQYDIRAAKAAAEPAADPNLIIH